MTEPFPEILVRTETTAPTTAPPPANARWRTAWLAIPFVGLVVCGAAHWLQLDHLAALTAVPPWAWLCCWTLFALPALWNADWRQRGFSLLVALAFALLCIEQTGSAFRSLRAFSEGASAEPPLARVVTLNCNAGSMLAAEEVTAQQPDVVLLQESPGQADVVALGQSLFGEQAAVVWSADCSIIARGTLRPGFQAPHFVHATWITTAGESMEVVCARLEPPLVRFDLWDPACWREHTELRRTQRQQVDVIAAALAQLPPAAPVLLGGDLNVPAGDGALAPLRLTLRDGFDQAGRAWGATVLNGLPVHRFDQLWHSKSLRPRLVTAIRTEHSDHRLVLGEFDRPIAAPGSSAGEVGPSN